MSDAEELAEEANVVLVDRQLAAAEAALVAGDITGADALAERAAPHLAQPLMHGRARRVHGRYLLSGRTITP